MIKMIKSTLQKSSFFVMVALAALCLVATATTARAQAEAQGVLGGSSISQMLTGNVNAPAIPNYNAPATYNTINNAPTFMTRAGNANASCTTDKDYEVLKPPAGQGIISSIVTKISAVLAPMSQQLFQGILADSGFRNALVAALTLYVAVYGILFTVALVQVTAYDFIIRMIKISIVAFLLQPGAWNFFSVTVLKFFNDGTNDMINAITTITVGGQSYIKGQSPFTTLDAVVSTIFSAKMFITILATFTTGPYGILFGILLVVSLFTFLKSMLQVMWIYVMSLTMRTLLFGLAPIFITCLLFSRTKHLFDGWINQIVNACLQPVLLFIFFAFFMKLLEAAAGNITAVPVCWSLFPEGWRGSPIDLLFWRFTVQDSSGVAQPFEGNFTFTGSNTPGGKIFPLDLITILTFFILAELSGRFNDVVVQIASQLAGAASNLSEMPGMMSNAFGNRSLLGGGGGAGGGGGLLGGLGGGFKSLFGGNKNTAGDAAGKASGTTGTRK